MYCPQCARLLTDDEKFCRSCGLDLQKVSEVLSSEHQSAESDIPESQTAEHFQSRKVILHRRAMITMIVALMTGCLIPIIVGLNMYYPGLTPLIPILAGLAGFILFSGVILMFYADGLPKVLADPDSAWAGKLPKEKLTNKLPPERGPEYIPSVTESATDLLESVKTKEKRS